MQIFYPYGGTSPGTGDVVGPGSSTDNAVVLFNGTTGKIIKSSATIFGASSSFIFDSATPATFTGTDFQSGVNDFFGIPIYEINVPTSSLFRFSVNGSQIFYMNEYGMRMTTSAAVGATIPMMKLESSGNVSLPASEFNNVLFDFSQTQNFISGTIQSQREIYFRAPTYSGTAPGTTFTNASTLGIEGPPDQGSNSTVQVGLGINVGYKQLSCLSSIGGNFSPSGITNGIGATGVHAGLSVFNSSAIALGNQAATTSFACSIYLPSLQWSAITNTRTVTNLATIYIANAPSTSGTVAVTNGPYAIFVDAGATRLDGRLLLAQGSGISSANDITLGNDGSYFIFTGTTTLQRIATAGWTSGSVVTFGFTNSLTIQHGVASGGGFSGFECPYGFDIACENGTEIIARYSSSRDAWSIMSITPPA